MKIATTIATLLIGAAQGITTGTPVRVSAPDDQTAPTK